MRKQQFKRPELNFSLYEGRTRGKRMKYTYSDDEDEGYSDATSRRSTRNTGTHTPAEGPTVTLSGRQVRSRHGGTYGETMLSGTHTPAVAVGGGDGASDGHDEDGDVVERRPRRAAAANMKNGYSSKSRHIEGYNSVDEMDDEDDASEQDYGDDEEDDHVSIESDGQESEDFSQEDEEMEENILEGDGMKKSLVIKLPVKTPTPEKPKAQRSLTPENKSADSTRLNGNKMEGLQAEGYLDTTATAGSRLMVQPSPSTEVEQKSSRTMEASKSIDIPPQSGGSHTFPAPLSPSLAFRGSPEKIHGFPAPINVGQSGA
jgi:hypothetical protein